MIWWWKDRSIRMALVVGFLLRLIPMVVWAEKTCIRDECTYELIADAMVHGQGITGTMGWLWAPAFPTLIAIIQLTTGYPRFIQALHLPAAAISTILLCALVRQMYEPAAPGRATRLAAWLYALNPTFIFYATSAWSETLYMTLLLGAVVALGQARGAIDVPLLEEPAADPAADPAAGQAGAARRAPGVWAGAWVGLLVGLCVLFRGVATYMLPIFVLGLVWGRWREARAWQAAGLCALAAAGTVAPYSAHASNRFEAFIISDRTLGQMMWMGNNEFPPMTFDYGNGLLKQWEFDEVSASGRPKCPMENPAHRDTCEVENGKRWIAAHPAEFLARVPLRVAQMLNPHSFLTRHLRWGRWKGLPDALDEAMILGVVAASMLTMVGGTLGFFAKWGRGRDSWYPMVAGSILLYHVAAIAVTAGLSRYRLPLEPLWMVFSVGFLVAPGAALARIGADRRWVVAAPVTGLLVWLILWFLPTGWPSWGSWGLL